MSSLHYLFINLFYGQCRVIFIEKNLQNKEVFWSFVKCFGDQIEQSLIRLWENKKAMN